MLKNYYQIALILLILNTGRAFKICDILTHLSENEITGPCKNQLGLICANASLLWNWFDSSSKYPISGLSYSSNQDFGNFDECLAINQKLEDVEILGKYCPYSVLVINPFLPGIPQPYSIDLDGEISVPTLTYLSLCIPNSCSPKEVGRFFIWGGLEDTDLIKILDSYQCVTSETNTSLEWSDIVYIVFLSLIFVIVVSSTIYDYLERKSQREPRQILISFSILTNGKKLFQLNKNTNKEEIRCLNGFRFISIMWVIAGHNADAFRAIPLINYAEIHDWARNAGVQYLASSTIAVDTFFFLSGLLLTYGYLKNTTRMPLKKQIFQIPIMIVYRYLRLTPALAILHFGLITVYRFLGSGPLWQSYYESLVKTCDKYWWSLYLYIQNYINYDDMCINHTWYLSADMQMFLLSPLILIPISILIQNKRTKLALLGIAVISMICIAIPIIIRFVTQSKIINTYDTHSRFINYLIGMFLAVILREFNHKPFPVTRIQNLLIWLLVLTIDLAFNLYYNHILLNYDLISDTLFNGLYRLIWSTSLAWMVYSCHKGFGGPINWFLSLPVFQIGARLTYCMYLLHAVIVVYWIGTFRTSYYWGDYAIFYAWCGHFIVTLIISLIWSLAFEAPMIVIEKSLLKIKSHK